MQSNGFPSLQHPQPYDQMAVIRRELADSEAFDSLPETEQTEIRSDTE